MERIREKSAYGLVFLLFVIGLVPFNFRPDFVVGIFGHAWPFHHLIYFGFGFWCLLIAILSFRSERHIPFFAILNLILFISLMLSALFTSYDRSEAIQSSVGIFLRGMAPGLLAYYLVVKDGKEEFVLKALVIFGLLVGFSAIYEIMSGHYFIFERFETPFPPTLGYAAGAIGQPLPLSILLNMIFPITLEAVYRKRDWAARIAIVAISLAILMTYRRTGYLMLGLSTFLFIGFTRASSKAISLILAGALLCGFFILTIKPYREKFAERFKYADTLYEIQNSHRTRAYAASWDMAKESPFFGVGTRQYHNVYEKYAHYEGALDTPDSQYLRFLSENGLAGLIIFLVYLGYVLRRLYAGRNNVFGVGVLLSIFSLSLGLVINDSLYWPSIQYLAWILMGMGVGLADRQESHVE